MPVRLWQDGVGVEMFWGDQKIEVPEPAPPNKNKAHRLQDLLSVETFLAEQS